MTKIDIVSGFLGAGKTTLIKKLIGEALAGQKIVLIENEFGEIGIDGGFLQDAGVNITEMNSGCICCSLVGDFGKALAKVLDEYAPDRILIEPSGVGKLSDVIRAVQGLEREDILLNSFTAVVDAKKCKIYMKNFGEFFNNQIENASTVILSHTDGLSAEKLADTVERVRSLNDDAPVVTTPWDQLTGAALLAAMESTDTLAHQLHELEEEEACPVCGGHHHHHHHDDDDDDHDEHEHHHHHHDHDHGEECTCGCHDHEHHHHADEVFASWGRETTRAFSPDALAEALAALDESGVYGTVLRAKGIVAGTDGAWLHFDYVPGEPDVRTGPAGVTGRLCVIGSDLKEDALAALFGL
ncbi:MAG: GTP-binding protein [Clostridia bacterium]|nr:GTP-binding protein [Clostridia bacterium]